MRTFACSRGIALAAVVCGARSLLGCGPSRGTDGRFVPADHLPFPQVVWQGGPVLTAPKVVSVTFPGDPNTSAYEQLGASIASSPWWETVRAGYCEGNGGACLGDGPTGVSVQLTTAPAAAYSDMQIQSLLGGEIARGVLPMPDATMPVSNTLYVLYVPSTTTIDHAGGSSCLAFDGYHSAMAVGSRQVPYVVVDECDRGSASATLASTTATAAHEAIEAAADPGDPPGYYLALGDLGARGWNDVLGGEVADLCNHSLGWDRTEDGTFVVERVWSNALASAGGDPCAPVTAGSVYFNASPSQAEYVLRVGGSVTFEASAFSTAPMSDWQLAPQDVTASATPYLSFSIRGGTDTATGPIITVNNGSKPEITMTLLADPAGATRGEADGVLVSTTRDPANPTVVHIWPFIVISASDR